LQIAVNHLEKRWNFDQVAALIYVGFGTAPRYSLNKAPKLDLAESNFVYSYVVMTFLIRVFDMYLY